MNQCDMYVEIEVGFILFSGALYPIVLVFNMKKND